jgi:hypothetical protein
MALCGPSRSVLRPPNAANSLEESLQVYNEDVHNMTPSELANAAFVAARIADRDPQRFVWRGVRHVTARQWADERIALCLERLAAPTPQRHKRKVRAWVP